MGYGKTIKILVVLGVSVLAGMCFGGCGNKASEGQAALKEEVINSIVNVPNSNGSMTPVLIRRSGNIWVGPKGEVYTAYPTVEQLKSLYSL